MNPIHTESDIDTLLRAAKALAVIAAWNELGLFDALADGPMPVSELSADARALEVTVPVLKHLGLLYGEGDRIALSRTARELRQRGQLPTARNFELLADQARMLEVLEHGGPIAGQQGTKGTDGGTRADDPDQTSSFLDMLYRRSEVSARLVYEWLAPLLPDKAAVLDLGGGHGRYARVFADAGHAATLFDFPYVIEYADARHGNALAYIGGDFRERDVDLGGPYDLILLSNIVHGESGQANRQLIGRLSGALAAGGYLVLKDMFIDQHGQDPENAVFFGLTALFYTSAGRSHSLEDARAWLMEAALEQVETTVLEGFQLVRAQKPAKN